MGKTIITIVCIIWTLLFCNSCKDEDFINEQRAGYYKITKVEYLYFSDSLPTPDSVKTYENDTLGFFNFYNSSPQILYSYIQFPSKNIYSTYENRWKVHEDDPHILVISQLFNNTWRNYKYYVDNPTKKKQTWTIAEDFYNGTVIIEKISVTKQ